MAKKVVVMSGVSGSGKSSFVKKLLTPDQYKSLVVSADNFFYHDGVYRFEPSMLGEAHGSCFFEYIEALRNKVDNTIIVDNTNTTVAEIAPYMLAAQAYEWQAEIVTLCCKGVGALMVCAERNKHGVNLHTIGRQDAALRNRVLSPWWKNTEMAVEFDSVYKSIP